MLAEKHATLTILELRGDSGCYKENCRVNTIYIMCVTKGLFLNIDASGQRFNCVCVRTQRVHKQKIRGIDIMRRCFE